MGRYQYRLEPPQDPAAWRAWAEEELKKHDARVGGIGRKISEDGSLPTCDALSGTTTGAEMLDLNLFTAMTSVFCRDVMPRSFCLLEEHSEAEQGFGTFECYPHVLVSRCIIRFLFQLCGGVQRRWKSDSQPESAKRRRLRSGDGSISYGLRSIYDKEMRLWYINCALRRPRLWG